MGLFDKLLGKGHNEQKEATLPSVPNAEEKLPAEFSDIEKAISNKVSHLHEFPKVSLTDITALGGIFASLSPALRTIASTVNVSSMGYMPINNLAGEALKAVNKANPNLFVGAFKDAATGKSTFARMIKLGPQTISTTSVMPINPLLLAMAVMMVQINHKLDAIQKTQQTILSFMQEDKKAKLQGDLNMLSDILDKYKYNWDNEQYRNNFHIKTLDIKQGAEQNIIFYQSQIAKKINDLPVIHLDHMVKDVMGKIADDFHNYAMALYLFSFSSYLEVMLLGNFAKDYLQSVAQRAQEYQEFYKNQFNKCRDFIEKISAESVQTKVQDALGQTGKFLGNLIASSPLLSKGPVDEWLKDGGELLLKGKDEKITKILAAFDERQETGCELFVDSIRNVESVCNNIEGVLFDNENLYLLS